MLRQKFDKKLATNFLNFNFRETLVVVKGYELRQNLDKSSAVVIIILDPIPINFSVTSRTLRTIF